MGLDFAIRRIECRDKLFNLPVMPHWSYGGFNTFRQRLSEQAKIDLGNMVGFGGALEWDEIKDPISPLLNHSDCDGLLDYDDCQTVAPRLRKLVKDWPDDYDRKHAIFLAEAMEYCAENDCELMFC